MNRIYDEDNIRYFKPAPLGARMARRLAGALSRLFGGLQRSARWKKHNVYRLRQSEKNKKITKEFYGSGWRRHRIPVREAWTKPSYHY